MNRIDSDPHKHSKLLFILDGSIINGAYLLTLGVVLSGYAIYLGTGDFLTALLNNCTNYATILSVISFVIFERTRRRKELLLTMNFVSRTLMFLITFIPLVIHGRLAGSIALTLLAVASEMIWGIYRVGWMVWMMSVVPRDARSAYVYKRNFLVRLTMALSMLLSGFVLDKFNKGYMGFLILFCLSYVLSLLDVAVLTRVRDQWQMEADTPRVGLGQFLEPVKAPRYRNLLIFVFLFYFSLMIGSSFTPIYMIKYLKLDYRFISAISVVSMGTMVASNLFWGRVEKNKGFRFIIFITAFISSGELLVLTFLNGKTYLLLFLSSAIAGLGAGGFQTSLFTYRYSLMPEGGKTVYEGWFYFAFGLGILLAPFAGKAVIDLVPAFTNTVFANSKFQLLYLAAFTILCCILLFSLMRLITRNRAPQKSVSL